MYKEPELCQFSKVEISVPRARLLRLLGKKHYLTHEESVFLKVLIWRVEAANNKILHVRSIAEKALLKSTFAKT